MLDRILDSAYARLARSETIVRAALRARNVAGALIAHRISEGADPRRNGEGWLAALAGRDARQFVDVGANVGDWTALVRRSARPDVAGLLVEPSPVAAARLRKRFAGCARIEVLEGAMGAAEGEATFFAEPDAGVMSSLVAGAAGRPTQALAVRVHTLDHEFERRGISHVDLLKVDTEGYDLHVLRGAAGTLAERRIAIVQFEYQPAWADAGSTIVEAKSWLLALGYRVFVLRSDGLFDLDYARFGEYRYMTNFVACSPAGLKLVGSRLRGPLLSR